MKILFKLNPYLQQRQREKPRWIFPIKLAMYATYLRDQGHEIVWDGELDDSVDRIITSEDQIDVSFLKLPSADRILTDAKNKKWQKNGNFKFHYGTYIQSASSCHWGRCIFCVEKGKKNEIRPVLSVHEELKEIKALNFSEVFDDSGSFPKGEWLDEFLGMENPGLVFGCNARMEEHPWRRMKHWGMRMILFGIESQNQRTLDKIHKGVIASDIRHIVDAAKAGLDCHGAFMIFPWETHEETMHTINVVKKLLIDGVLKTAQCSLYDVGGDRDTEKSVYLRKIYGVAYSPKFWINKVTSIRNREDLKYLGRQILASIQK